MAMTTRPVPKVAVEESKAQRIQRQQARFRDRGGTFVPSDKNPLADILLARAVTGESPSKAKSFHSKTERHLPTGSPARRTAILSPSRESSNAAWPKGAGSRLEKTFSENCNSVPRSSNAAKRVMESVRKKGSKKRKSTHLEEDDQTLVEAPQKAGSRGKKRKSVVIEDTHDMSGDEHSATTRKQRSHLQKVSEKLPSSKRALDNTRKEPEGILRFLVVAITYPPLIV
ncbi:hypothetical protein EDD16DRAFT_1648271 [Pisolithus croceorrhizus]|nr:hypothetical protein EDD16DRAFT_1648271 [Pisolithus croceorrhizus]